MKKNNLLAHIIGSTSRTLLALTFLFSGFVKCIDPLGTVYKIEDYLKAFGGWCNDLLPYAGIAAVCLIALEFLLGVCLLTNVRTKWTSWITLAFMLVMTPLTLWIALTNPVSDCGCFGDALVLTNWQTFYKNVVLMVLVIMLLCCQKAIPQLWSWWAELIIALCGLAVAGGIMYHSYTHLPSMDFRPYKVGNHIPTLMEDEIPPKIDVFYTFQKDGHEQEFVYAERPDLQGDSSWTFVKQETRVLEEGKEPTIHDFEILQGEYNEELGEYLWINDITYDILESEEPVALVVMYDLKKTDRKQMDKLMNIIHEYSTVYFLTGSGEDEIVKMAEELGWDEETTFSTFCVADPVTLKTIVRANPGLVVIQNGTVMEKKNFRQVEFN